MDVGTVHVGITLQSRKCDGLVMVTLHVRVIHESLEHHRGLLLNEFTLRLLFLMVVQFHLFVIALSIADVVLYFLYDIPRLVVAELDLLDMDLESALLRPLARPLLLVCVLPHLVVKHFLLCVHVVLLEQVAHAHEDQVNVFNIKLRVQEREE